MQKTNSDGTIYAADKVGFGIYHFAQGGMDARRVADSETFALDGGDRALCDRQEQLDYMNFYIYRLDRSCYSHLARIKEMGCGTWVFYEPFVSVEINGQRKVHLRAGWREEITKLVDDVKKAGLWDAVIGFQYDEPLLKVETDVFEEFTGFMAGFGKRQLAIFSLYEIVEGSNPKAGDPEYGALVHLVTPESCRWLTDVGFDWYDKPNPEKFRNMNDVMFKMLGRDNLYLWMVPTTWTRGENPAYTEDLCIESLEMCKDILLESKYPGGLFCYTWRSWGIHNEALDYHFHTANRNRWERLENKMIETGRELREITLKPLPEKP